MYSTIKKQILFFKIPAAARILSSRGVAEGNRVESAECNQVVLTRVVNQLGAILPF